MSIPNNFPENVLKLIIKEMVKEGFESSQMETIYEDTSDLERVESVLKKFGITVTDLYEFGFYAMLFIENYDEETQTINSPLIIPKKYKVDVWFGVDLTKQITEKWKLELDTYSTNKAFITDMMSTGDMSYHDGKFYDDEVNDTDFNDWNILDITVKDLNESKKKKNIIKEGKKSFRKFEKELSQNVLKLILKKLISNLPDVGTITDNDNPYNNNDIWRLIDNTLKIFGVTHLYNEEYGFFWQLYLNNIGYEDGDGLIIPKLKLFNVDIEEKVTKWGFDYWKHNIYSYNEDFVVSIVDEGDNFDLYSGDFINDSTDDSETSGYEIVGINEISLDENLAESKKTKKLIKDNNDSELIRLEKLKEQIEKRIKEITS